MEQLLLFIFFYERMLDNAANKGRRLETPPVEPLAPILWHRIDELKPGRLREGSGPRPHLGRSTMSRLDHAADLSLR